MHWPLAKSPFDAGEITAIVGYAADAKSIGIAFSGPVNAAAFTPGMITADFGLGDIPATSYTQDGANAVVGTAAGWDDDATGAAWNLVTAPAGIHTPATGIVT